MKNILITDGSLILHAKLNDTLAAKSFYTHLPIDICGSKDKHAYCGRVPNDVYDPLEKQIGWKKRDIHYGNGCFAILFEEDTQTKEEKNIMVIGTVSRNDMKKIKLLKNKITVKKRGGQENE